MNITSGLYSNAVWQRAADNLSDQPVTGTAEPGSTLVCAIRGRNGVRQTLRGIKVDPEGNFAFRITDLPIGGPYVVSVADDTGAQQVIVDNILIGDVWLLAGQSNMQGVGALENEPPAVDSVRYFGMDYKWDVAHGRLHDYKNAAAQIYNKIRAANNNGVLAFNPNYPYTGVGPGTAIGQTIFKKTGVPQGLLPVALGGTNMDQWDPKLKDQGKDGSLYAAALEAVRLSGGRVAGMFWYQGCSDVYEPLYRTYAEKTRSFFGTIRADLGFPAMPVVMVQIAGCVNWGPDPAADAQWSCVREAERQFQNKADKIAVVPACDLAYEDGIHLDMNSQYILGRRCGEAMCTLLDERGALPMPIELEGMEYHLNEPLNIMEIEVTFRNVSGELSSHGQRAHGFTVVRPDGVAIGTICAVRPHGNKVLLRLSWTTDKLPDGQKIAYAYGATLNANITDSAGRSLPAFGPIEIL